MGRAERRRPYVKDAFHDYVVHGQADAVNPDRTGTKAAALLRARRPGRAAHDGRAAAAVPRRAPRRLKPTAVDTVFADRVAEADEFYASITPAGHAAPTRRR